MDKIKMTGKNLIDIQGTCYSKRELSEDDGVPGIPTARKDAPEKITGCRLPVRAVIEGINRRK